MLPSAPVHAMVTQHDADYVLASPDWPTPNPPSYCHTELADDMTLHVPELAGRRYTLVYQGQVAGQHAWKIEYNYANYSSKGCTAATLSQNGTVAELFDVRSRTMGNLTYARLRESGGLWRLEAAR